MGRWADMASDEARLPEGIQRVGYDADSQKYTFFEASTGKYYESSSGNRYGVLHPISRQNNDHRFAPSAGAPRRSNTFAGTRSSRHSSSSKRSSKRDSTFSQASTIAESVDSSSKDKVKDKGQDYGDSSRRSSSSTARSTSPAPDRHFSSQAVGGGNRRRAQTFEGILNEPQDTVADNDYGNKEAYRTMLPSFDVKKTLRRFGSRRETPAGRSRKNTVWV